MCASVKQRQNSRGVRNTPLGSSPFLSQKALAVASNGVFGYRKKLVDKICEILGAESVVVDTSCRWKTPIETALQATGADRRDLVRAFIGGRKKNRFRWEWPMLETLIVFYSTSSAVRSLDSTAKGAKICALACAQFGEDSASGEFLTHQFVEVSALLHPVTLRNAGFL